MKINPQIVIVIQMLIPGENQNERSSQISSEYKQGKTKRQIGIGQR